MLKPTSLNRGELFFFLCILYSGLALSFYRSHAGLISLFFFGLMLFFHRTSFQSRSLLIMIFVWLVYFSINTGIIASFHPFFMGTYIAYIFIAYWLISSFGARLFLSYENIVFKLTLVSLFFYVIQLMAPSVLYQIMGLVDLSGGLFDDIYYRSIGIYTFHQKHLSEAFPRNAGFTWEPGPFSCFVALALFFNMARNQVSFKDQGRVIIFVVAIITAQSTTGFLLLFALLAWYSWARFEDIAFRFFLVPIVTLIIALVYFNVPFLKEKIDDQSQQDIYALIEHAETSGRSYNPGRFASLVLRYEDFKNYPVAGYGGNPKLQYGYLGEGNVVSAVSGIGKIFGQYGLIGSVIFVFVLYRSGILMADHFGYSGFLVFPIMVLMIGFSFSIIETPAILVFLLLPFFVKRSDVEARH